MAKLYIWLCLLLLVSCISATAPALQLARRSRDRSDTGTSGRTSGRRGRSTNEQRAAATVDVQRLQQLLQQGHANRMQTLQGIMRELDRLTALREREGLTEEYSNGILTLLYQYYGNSQSVEQALRNLEKDDD